MNKFQKAFGIGAGIGALVLALSWYGKKSITQPNAVTPTSQYECVENLFPGLFLLTLGDPVDYTSDLEQRVTNYVISHGIGVTPIVNLNDGRVTAFGVYAIRRGAG